MRRSAAPSPDDANARHPSMIHRSARGRAALTLGLLAAGAGVVWVADAARTEPPKGEDAATRFAEAQLRNELKRWRLTISRPQPSTLEIRLPGPTLLPRVAGGDERPPDPALVEAIARRALALYAPAGVHTREVAQLESVRVVVQGKAGVLGLVRGPDHVYSFEAPTVRPPLLQAPANP